MWHGRVHILERTEGEVLPGGCRFPAWVRATCGSLRCGRAEL